MFEARPHAMPADRQFDLSLRLRRRFAGPAYGADQVSVSTAYCGAAYVQQMVAAWRNDVNGAWAVFAAGATTRQWTILNGVRAMKVEYVRGSDKEIDYLLWSGRCGYALEIRVEARQWPTLAPTLNVIAQTFRIV